MPWHDCPLRQDGGVLHDRRADHRSACRQCSGQWRRCSATFVLRPDRAGDVRTSNSAAAGSVRWARILVGRPSTRVPRNGTAGRVRQATARAGRRRSVQLSALGAAAASVHTANSDCRLDVPGACCRSELVITTGRCLHCATGLEIAAYLGLASPFRGFSGLPLGWTDRRCTDGQGRAWPLLAVGRESRTRTS
jgi:hypothetical protein